MLEKFPTTIIREKNIFDNIYFAQKEALGVLASKEMNNTEERKF